MSELSGHIAAVRRHLKAIPKCEIPDEKLPDVIGVLNELRALTQQIVGSLKIETEPAKGEVYELVRDGAYQYSYNIQGIVKRRIDADPSMKVEDVIVEMFNNGVFGNMRWTQLNQWASTHDVSLTVSQHEVTEGDVDAEVGKWWKPKPHKVQPVKLERGEVL